MTATVRGRARNGAGHIKQRELKGGKIVYDAFYSFRNERGEPDRGSKTFASYREAEDFLSRNSADHANKKRRTTNQLTVASYLEDWLQNTASIDLKESTLHSYTQKIKLYINPTMGDVPLRDLEPRHVNAMIATMKKKGLSPRTQQYARQILQKALNDAKKARLIAENVVEDSVAPKQRRYRPRFLTADEARRFLDATKGDRLEAMYSVALAFGMREGETLGLLWSDVDLDRRIITLRHNLVWISGQPPFIDTTKSEDSDRRIVLLPRHVDQLRAHKARQEAEKQAAGDGWERRFPEICNLVFSTPKGDPIANSTLLGQYRRLLHRAGLPIELRYHDLRHSCASILGAQGVPLTTVSKLLGHSSIQITGDIYTHVDEASQRAALTALDAALFADAEG
jgi:integrase